MILTKKEACESVIDDFCMDERIDRKNLNDRYVIRSSKLAVAMEYLGLIKDDEMKEYASNRGGTFMMHTDNKKVKIFSFREFLELLPEEKNN
jgi:hypothetical protein